MLQTVPEPVPNKYGLDPNMDIFDGFGNAGMGVASTLPQHTHYDAKRIEEIATSSGENNNNSNPPFTSPPIMPTAMEYPGLAQYTGFPDLTVGMQPHPQQDPHQNGLGVQARMARGVPMRQNSTSSAFNVISRSVPEYHNLTRQDSGTSRISHENLGHDGLGGMGLDMPYR